MIHLMHRAIDPDNMPILYDTPLSPDAFAADFEVRDGAWHVDRRKAADGHLPWDADAV